MLPVKPETSSDDDFLIESSDETFHVETGSDNTFSIGDGSDDSDKAKKKQLAIDFSDGMLPGLQATFDKANVTPDTIKVESSKSSSSSPSGSHNKRVPSAGRLVKTLSGVPKTSSSSSVKTVQRAKSAALLKSASNASPNSSSSAGSGAPIPSSRYKRQYASEGNIKQSKRNQTAAGEVPASSQTIAQKGSSQSLKERVAAAGSELSRKGQSHMSSTSNTTPKSNSSAAALLKRVSSLARKGSRTTPFGGRAEGGFKNSSTPKSSSSDTNGPSSLTKRKRSSSRGGLRSQPTDKEKSKQTSGPSSADDESSDVGSRRVLRTSSKTASRPNRITSVGEEGAKNVKAANQLISWWRSCSLRLLRKRFRERESTLGVDAERRYAANLIKRFWKTSRAAAMKARRKRQESIINKAAMAQELAVSSTMIQHKWKQTQAAKVKHDLVVKKENKTRSDNKQSTLQEKEFAATLIQSRWRARQSREIVSCLLQQRQPDYLILSRQSAALERSYAARMITRWGRLMAARIERRKRRALRDQHLCLTEQQERVLWNTTLIQSWIRGCNGRKLRNSAILARAEKEEIDQRCLLYDQQYNERLTIRQKHFDFIGKHWHWSFNNGEEDTDEESPTKHAKFRPIFRFISGTLSNPGIALRTKQYNEKPRIRNRAAALFISTKPRSAKDVLRESNSKKRKELHQKRIQLFRSFASNYLPSLLKIQRIGKAAATRLLINTVLFARKNATKIQLTWRSYQARCERRRRWEQQIARKEKECKLRREVAAESIQLAYRSSKAREKVSKLKGIRQLESQIITVLEFSEDRTYNASVLQRVGRAFTDRLKLKMIAAATLKRNINIITSFCRWKLSRNVVQRRVERHIILIQNTFRRYQAYREAWWKRRLRSAEVANKELQELRRESVLAIQRWARLCLAKRFVRELKKVTLARDAWDVITEKIEQSVIIIQCAVRTMIAKRRSQLQRDSLNRLHKMELDAHIDDLQQTLKTITQMYPSHQSSKSITAVEVPIATSTPEELNDTLQTIMESYPGIRNNIDIERVSEPPSEATEAIMNVSSELSTLQNELQAMAAKTEPDTKDIDTNGGGTPSPQITNSSDSNSPNSREKKTASSQQTAIKQQRTPSRGTTQKGDATESRRRSVKRGSSPPRPRTSQVVTKTASLLNGTPQQTEAPEPVDESQAKSNIRSRPLTAPCSDVPQKASTIRKDSKPRREAAARSPLSSSPHSSKLKHKKGCEKATPPTIKYKSDMSPYKVGIAKNTHKKTSVPQPALSPLSADTQTERQIPQSVASPSSLGTPPVSRQRVNTNDYRNASPLYAVDTEVGGPTVLVDPNTGAGYQIVPYSHSNPFPLNGAGGQMYETTTTATSTPPSRDPRRRRKLPGSAGGLTGEVVESLLFGSVAADKQPPGLRTRHEADLLLADAVATSIRKRRSTKSSKSKSANHKRNTSRRASECVPADGQPSNLILYRPLSAADRSTPVHLISIEEDAFPSQLQGPSGSAVQAARHRVADTVQAWS